MHYAHTGSGRLVHLAVDQSGLVDNAALGHFTVQVVALTGALANAGEHRVAVVLGGNTHRLILIIGNTPDH